MATFNVPPRENFNFHRPEEFDRWMIRFERFRVASGLKGKDKEIQINTLIYCLGKDADDTFKSLSISDANSKKI